MKTMVIVSVEKGAVFEDDDNVATRQTGTGSSNGAFSCNFITKGASV